MKHTTAIIFFVALCAGAFFAPWLLPWAEAQRMGYVEKQKVSTGTATGVSALANQLAPNPAAGKVLTPVGTDTNQVAWSNAAALFTGSNHYVPKMSTSGLVDSSLYEDPNGPVATSRVLYLSGTTGILGTPAEGLSLRYSSSFQEATIHSLYKLTLDTGTLQLYGGSSVAVQAAGVFFYFPTSIGGENDCLKLTGSGVTSWGPCNAGTGLLPSGDPGQYAKIVTGSVVVTSTTTSTSTATTTSWAAVTALSNATPQDVGARPASTGTATDFSPSSHKHHLGSNYPAPGWIIQATGTGTDTGTDRSAMWVNPFSTSTPTADGTSGNVGTATTFPHSDHQHQGDGNDKVSAYSGATPQYLSGALISSDSSISISQYSSGTSARVDIKQTSHAPASHASTHVAGASDPLPGLQVQRYAFTYASTYTPASSGSWAKVNEQVIGAGGTKFNVTAHARFMASAEGSSYSHLCGLSIMADSGTSASTLRGPKEWVQAWGGHMWSNTTISGWTDVATQTFIGTATAEAQFSIYTTGDVAIAAAVYQYGAHSSSCTIPAGELVVYVDVYNN